MSAKQSGGRGAHLGGTMSCVDILCYLYFGKVLRFNSKKPKWHKRDRMLIGKGHAHLALYHIWSDLGFFSKKKLMKKRFGFMVQLPLEKYLVAAIVETFKQDVPQYEQKITIKEMYFCIP